MAPGLLSWPAWEALRSAASVLAAPGHPALPALQEAGIGYQVAAEPGAGSSGPDAVVVWLPEPDTDPLVPPGARLIRGSADLPGAHLLDLVATMDRLRTECPWDSQQTHQSLAPYLLEEPYEALEALESGDARALCEELGDVLLQVMFHARIAAERDDGTGFSIDDVADAIVAKLIRRHPHVFGGVSVSGADEVNRNWDEIKREEKRARAAAQEQAGAEPVPPPCSMVCRSASRRWRWPPSCSAGPPGPGRLPSWRCWKPRLTPSRLTCLSTLGRELFRLVSEAREAGLRPRAGAPRGRPPLPRPGPRLGAFVAVTLPFRCFWVSSGF